MGLSSGYHSSYIPLDVVYCIWVSLTGTTVAPFWAHLSAVWDWFGHCTLTLYIIRANGAPLMLLCNGATPWQCSQGYLEHIATIT